MKRKRSGIAEAKEVSLAEQNAMAIKRLEEQVHRMLPKDQARIDAPPNTCAASPSKREIPDSLDGLRISVGDLEDIVSGLVDRLSPISLATPPATAGTGGPTPCPYSTDGATAIFSLHQRVRMLLERVRSIYDRVQV